MHQSRLLLITGASSGIGLALVNAMAEKGFMVIAGVRTEEG